MNKENQIVDDNDQFGDENEDDYNDDDGMNDILPFKKRIQKHEKVPHANF